MPIKAFIFDLDGVIVDTAVFHYQAWKRMANEKLGFDIDEEFNETLKGVSRVESLERILALGHKTISEKEKEDFATQKNDWYLELVGGMTTRDILPGIVSLLEQCKQADIKIGLGSVSKNARMILEKVGIINYFDVIIDGTKISRGKPDPEVFIKGAEELGVEPWECVVFEDAPAGVEAAIRAGIKTVGIGTNAALPNATVVYKNVEGVSLNNILQHFNEG